MGGDAELRFSGDDKAQTMSEISDLFIFAGVMALGQFSPGPDMVLLTRTALKSGVQAGVKMALGIACGLMVHTTLAVAGLALILKNSPRLLGILRWVAAAYLGWLAYGLIKEMFIARNMKKNEISGQAVIQNKPFLRGFLCNLLNPKVAIVLVALCTPFLKGEHPAWWPLAIWGIIVGQGLVLWSLWAWLLQWQPLRQGYERASLWIDGAFGIALIALAIRLMIG
jgi:threonine efflux protein